MPFALRDPKYLVALCLLQCSIAMAAEDYDCLIEARDTVEVRSPVEGLIEQVLVRRGDMVRKGTVLVNLESGAERAAVEMARIPG